MKLHSGMLIFFKEDIHSHIGSILIVPKLKPCKVIKYNNHAVTIEILCTGKTETVRKIDKRMVPFGNEKLIELLYG